MPNTSYKSNESLNDLMGGKKKRKLTPPEENKKITLLSWGCKNGHHKACHSMRCQCPCH